MHSAPKTAPPPRAEPTRVAVIDIGSSALRLELAELATDGQLRRLESLQRAVPLGQDCIARGRLQRKTINLAIEVLRGFLKIMEPYAVRGLRAIATGAVRDAGNQELFVERVYMATGISVEVLSGAEEDRLIYAAVRDAFERDGLELAQDALIVEQGGTSLELALIQGGEVVSASSFPLGTLRLLHAVNPEHRGAPERLDLLKRYVASAIDDLEPNLPLGETRNLVLVGAEAQYAAARILGPEAADGGVGTLTREEFLRFVRSTKKLRPEQPATGHGLTYEERRTLLPALLTHAELLKRTPAPAVFVPRAAMRDGALLAFAAEARGERGSELEEQTFASAENLGRRFQYDEQHAHQVADLACALFDTLAEEHGLGRRERRLLRVAALLHDIGLFISSNSHHKHSEYIISASDLFGVRAEERAIVAAVARYHRRALPQASHAGFSSLSRRDRAAVSKLAALLRVADALDRSHGQHVHALEARLDDEELVIRVKSAEDLSLERLALRAKADLFEEVFGRKVVLQQHGRAEGIEDE